MKNQVIVKMLICSALALWFENVYISEAVALLEEASTGSLRIVKKANAIINSLKQE